MQVRSGAFEDEFLEAELARAADPVYMGHGLVRCLCAEGRLRAGSGPARPRGIEETRSRGSGGRGGDGGEGLMCAHADIVGAWRGRARAHRCQMRTSSSGTYVHVRGRPARAA